MPQKVHAAPAPSRRPWGLVIVICCVAAGLMLAARSCARQRSAAPVAAQLEPAAAPGLSSATGANDRDGAPAAAPASTGSQMRAMLFEMDANGLHLSRSSIAQGRAKAPPISSAPRRLEFEVYGPDGTVTYAGAFDHPMLQHLETANEKGEFTSLERQVPNGSCLVRIPAELPATRIEFFDVDATMGAPERRSIGSFSVQ